MEILIFSTILVVLVVIAIAVFINSKKETTKYKPLPDYTNIANYTNNKNSLTTPNVFKEDSIEDKIRKNNPNFSENNFKRFVEMVYITYLSSITNLSIPNNIMFLHKDMYETLNNFINTLKTANRRVIHENIIIDNISFLEYNKENDIETIKILLRAHLNSYDIDHEGKVISGYRSRIISKEEVLEFQRNHNDLFKNNSLSCPHCLAPLKNISERCVYCGTAVKYNDTTNDGWKLCNIDKYYKL